MVELQSFHITKRAAGFGLGIILAHLVAFYSIIIFWPQGNPFDAIKISIPKGASLKEISQQLHGKRVISNERTFLMAVRTLGYEKDIPAGSYTLRDARTNYGIIHQLVYGTPELRKVTILEGWNLKQIASELSVRLGMDEEEILSLCSNKKFTRKLGIPAPTLEGFLYPDTYYFFEGDEPENVLKFLVSEYRKIVDDEIIRETETLGFTELEIVTLASIIEGEAIYDKERPVISGVYHNRLEKGMKLQADPTIQYLIDDSPRRLLNGDLKIESPYNTYLNYGLPPGPINSPGKESILAALNPEENDYLYFVARGDGYHTFSKTQEEHNRAKRKFQRVRRKAKQNQ